MEFVPLAFSDSVAWLSSRHSLENLKKLAGYWPTSASKVDKQRLEVDLTLTIYPQQNPPWRYAIEHFDPENRRVEHNLEDLQSEDKESCVVFRKLTFLTGLLNPFFLMNHPKFNTVTEDQLDSTVIPFAKKRLLNAAFHYPKNTARNIGFNKNVIAWLQDSQFQSLHLQLVGRDDEEEFVDMQLRSGFLRRLSITGETSEQFARKIKEWISENMNEFEELNIDNKHMEIDLEFFEKLFKRWLTSGLPKNFALSGTAVFGYEEFSSFAKGNQHDRNAVRGDNTIWWSKSGGKISRALVKKINRDRIKMRTKTDVGGSADFLKVTLSQTQRIDFSLDYDVCHAIIYE